MMLCPSDTGAHRDQKRKSQEVMKPPHHFWGLNWIPLEGWCTLLSAELFPVSLLLFFKTK